MGVASYLKLTKTQRQKLTSPNVVGFHPTPWPQQFRIDHATVGTLNGNGQLDPQVLHRLRQAIVELPRLGILVGNTRTEGDFFN